MPALALLFNALVWGLSWYPLRQLRALHWHPLWATAVIYLLILAGALVLLRRALRDVQQRPALAALALAAGLTNTGFNWATATGDVVRVVLLFYLMPLWSVLLAWALLGERPHLPALLRMALALAGVAIVLKTPGREWPLPASLPDWLGVGAGFCFALTNVMLQRTRAASGRLRALAMFAGCTVVPGVGALAGSLLQQLPWPPAPAMPGWLLWAGLWGLGVIGANIALQYGAVRLSASAVSVIMLSEVLFASASSVAAGAATLSGRVLLGGALVMLGALWAALSPADRRQRPRPAAEHP